MKMNRRRSGVSSVIAELLLIVITVAMASIVGVFGFESFSREGNAFVSQLTSEGQQLQGNIRFEFVQFTPAMTGGVAYVQNPSPSVETVVQLQITMVCAGQPSCPVGSAVTFAPSTFTLQPGQQMSVPFTFAVQPHVFYQFFVLTQDGNNALQVFESGCPNPPGVCPPSP